MLKFFLPLTLTLLLPGLVILLPGCYNGSDVNDGQDELASSDTTNNPSPDDSATKPTEDEDADTSDANPDVSSDSSADSATMHDTSDTDNTDSNDTVATVGSDDTAEAEDTTDKTDTATEKDTADTESPSDYCSGKRPYRSLDLLLVVDNSVSMAQEQEMLGTAVFTLMNALTNPLDEKLSPIDDIRIGVTTSDMGVSFDGHPYEEPNPDKPRFHTPQVLCSEMGDNGAFASDYGDFNISIQENTISCTETASQCPPGWFCENLDEVGIGTCQDPNGNGQSVQCPGAPYDGDQTFVNSTVSDDVSDNALTLACLATSIGTNGCNYEQQLQAAGAGLQNNPGFVRADSLTAVIVVSDESDCSIESNEWHQLEELSNVTANLACGRHTDLLHSVDDLKGQMEATKIAAGGTVDDLVFAAITGVPAVDACQGTGDSLSECLDVEPGVNGSGTMEDPDEVGRVASSGVEQFYFEYACVRYADGDTDEDAIPVTAAYPGVRYIEMAQAFGDHGYIYSICNSDWGPAMETIATMVKENVKVVCLE